MTSDAPILFFDSGVGGLSVLAPTRALLPTAPIVYAANSAAFPYGIRSEAEIAARVPALLGRLLVLPYYPLSPDMLKGIVRIQLNRIVKRVRDSHGIDFHYTDDVIDLIVSRCNEVASGGRLIDNILTNTMLPEVSIALLNRQMSGEEVKEIEVTVEGDGFGYKFG